MRLFYLKCCFLLLGVTLATRLNAQSLISRIYFIPGGIASTALGPWISGQQDALFVVTNPGPDTVFADIEFEIIYNRRSAIRIRRLDALPIPVTTFQIGRTTDFNNPAFDVFEGQPVGNYDYELGLSIEELAQIVATRALLAGEWQFCIRFFEPGTDIEIPSGACLTLIMTEYQGPLPTYPIEDVILSPNLPVNFQWSPVTPALGFQQHVRLQIWEMLPGQEMIEAIRANLPIVDEEVRGNPRFFWSPAAIFLNPSDSMQYAWMLTPLEPAAILTQENGGASPPATFWLKDPRPRIDPYIPPCDSIDIGPDLIRDGRDAPAVSIGCDPKRGCTYEWLSDPPGYQAFRSRVKVRPSETTRYVLIQTDSSGTCVVQDEVWVVVKRDLHVELTVDVCGNIVAKASEASSNGSGNARLGGNPLPPATRDTMVILNGFAYDNNGQVIGNGPPPSISPCQQATPLASSPAPTPPYTYLWNNGATTPSIQPEAAGTYTCTVTENDRSASSSTDFVPSPRFRGEFTGFTFTKEMRLHDSDSQFVIWQYGNEGGELPVGNALSYRMVVDGPRGFHQVIEGSTLEGFQDGEFRWDGSPDANGVAARPGTYTCFFSVTNCDYPEHSTTRKYKFNHVRDATAARDQIQGHRKLNKFEFKVKRAKR